MVSELAPNIKTYDVVVVGAGAAGVGVGVSLRHAGIENFLIVDSHGVGASFDRWPAETRFITPSFPSNSIGMLDLNSVAIGISPAYSLQVEHPTGAEYAAHLREIAKYFELPVRNGVNVINVTKYADVFLLDTPDETLYCKHLIWAAGEFQYPRRLGFEGADLCRHTATVSAYDELPGDDFVIIGGYESGVDAAFHLASYDKRARLLDAGCPWESGSSDPSVSLSVYSLERMREEWFESQIELLPNCEVCTVKQQGDSYVVCTCDERQLKTSAPPLLATGFEGSLPLVNNLFEQRADGYPVLNKHDESTITSGLFLCGPSVRHDQHVFCFIYKYRQRFAVVAKAIATSLGLPAEGLEMYRQWGMYLDDLSCCGKECVC
ncbi:MAG: NAD(P)-binding domain-containing protein [Pirellulaceae bacterium]|nr:NAD(P)-binding domain-containing protein [Pirellulaceae bacterium]